MKKNSLLLVALIALTAVSCGQQNSTTPPVVDNTPPSVDILKDNYSVTELKAYIGDTFKLSTKLTKITDDIIWESTNPSVVSISNDGTVNVLAKGTVIISATAKNSTYLKDEIFINAYKKPEQLGVGSGLSKDDPIFKGDEGKDEPLEIRFIEMQQIYGDSIYIKKGDIDILIDSGYAYDGNTVNQVLTQYCLDKRLDLIMASHGDGDHIDGFPNALKSIENISLMVDYGGASSGNVGDIRKNFGAKGMKYYSAIDSINQENGASKVYYLTDELSFEVLNTGHYVASDAKSAGNKNSVAVIFYYKDFTFFTGGDLTSEAERTLLKNESLPEVTLYKSHHHGSNGSNSQEFLDTINPKGVAISAAKAGTFGKEPTAPNPNNTTNLNGTSGHPAKEAVSRIYAAPNISENLNVYWNAVNGTMKFTTYGDDDFTFQGSPALRGYYDLTLTGGKGVWNDSIKDFENRVTGEENKKLHETKVFQFRGYQKCLPEWAQEKYFGK